MRNLLLFLIRYGHLLIFILIEIICFSLIVRFNDNQKETWLNTVNLYTGQISDRINKVDNYFNLQEQNDSLSLENAHLLQQIIDFKVNYANNAYQEFEQTDTSINKVIPSRICNKTLRLRNNYFTLCKGSNHGIKKGMGVISADGVVGIVKSTTNNYSDVLLILHSDSRVSVAVKNKQYFGNMVWLSNNPKNLTVEAIPKYANIEIGDTIVTSGYSTVFPGGMEVGKVKAFEAERGGSNYTLDVEIFNDLELMEYVYVVNVENAMEKDSLHSKINPEN